ncbi:MAG: hypothetical protein VKJ64_18295 [Leptolyngbyaceae bacterium]|nr:hypothetical protein [Leptolyngbyaceae bacterium]
MLKSTTPLWMQAVTATATATVAKILPPSHLSWTRILTASRVVGCGLVGLLAVEGLGGTGAIALPSPNPSSQVSQPFPVANTATLEATPSTPTLTTAESPALQPLPDGTYLYGESPLADTIGSAYMVFDVNGQNVVGAFYMPYSSFDCFRGSFQGDELALTIRDSYEQTLFAYGVPLVDGEAIASTQTPAVTTQHPDGFYPIADLSDADQQILATCRAQTW